MNSPLFDGTASSTPMQPVIHQAARFINEIVLAEESDGDSQIGYASHFDLYHRSMTGCGASTAGIDSFLAELRRGVPVQTALAATEIPAASRQFVQHTFSVIESGNNDQLTDDRRVNQPFAKSGASQCQVLVAFGFLGTWPLTRFPTR